MRKPTVVIVALALGVLACAAASAQEQDPAVGSVKTLYASAAYEDALTAIERLKASKQPAVATDSRSLDQYRAFCLLALGREAEATKAMEDLFGIDPFFSPDASEVAPRVRALFSAVRRKMLPGVLQKSYSQAKASYDAKDYPAATDQFERVVKLATDPDIDPKAPGVSDVRTLATGFLELSRAAAAAAAPPPKPAEPEPAAPPPVVEKAMYDASDANVIPPVVHRQDVPSWPTTPPFNSITPTRPGVIELVIDEAGRVQHATMRQSINSLYDSMVVNAATNWRYAPATRNGVPVKYRKLIQIVVDRVARHNEPQ